jgi:hypothetical protein
MTESSAPRFPHVHVQLTGEDGNVFAIIGRVSASLTDAGVSDSEIQEFFDEVTTAGSYQGALRAVMRWVEVS